MQLNNLSNALYLRLTSKQFPVSKRDCQRFDLQVSIKDHVDKVDCAVQIFKTIVDSADIYFGIRAGQLSEALTDKVVKTILAFYSDLSVEDIEYAFERYHKEKTDWRNVTLDELMNPIKQYHKIKHAVSKEALKLQAEIKEQEERNAKEIEFLNLSIDLYNESLDKGCIFLGDIFHARKIYGNFISIISEDILIDMQKEANRRSIELREQDIYLHLSHTPERIYAKMVVEHALAKKMQLNQVK